MKHLARFTGACLAALAVTASAHAQSSSLLRRPGMKGAYNVKQVSLIRTPTPEPIRLHELINIKVEEKITTQANALTNRRRQTAYELSFDDLIVLLSGLRLRADTAIRQERPAIDIEALQNLRTISQFNRRDQLIFSIQAQVAEIKPNGNLVLEAHGSVAVNNEVAEYELSGIINPQDIDMRTRTIDSSKIANKYVRVDQVGPTRDSIKRGWFVRLTDMLTPF